MTNVNFETLDGDLDLVREIKGTDVDSKKFYKALDNVLSYATQKWVVEQAFAEDDE